MFHKFESDISNISLPDKFTFPFCYAPHRIVQIAAWQVIAYINARSGLANEMSSKMIGVLAVKSASEELGFLAAYSGNSIHCDGCSYFVPPIYDLSEPGGFFRSEEKVISEINAEIDRMLHSDYLISLKEKSESVKHEAESALKEYSEKMKLSKIRRDELREKGISSEQEAVLIRESQFEKAEKRRIKLYYNVKILDSEAKTESYLNDIRRLKDERRKRSAALQKRLFDQFVIINACGETEKLCELFEKTRHELPPAGAGECAAPKLLQYAFKHGFKPIAMGEFVWENFLTGKLRNRLQFYPACKNKCEPILNFMLQGLSVDPDPLSELADYGDIGIIYEDDSILVVDKPAEMPSVPGKGRRISVIDRLKSDIHGRNDLKVVHRLDMPTSGILIMAKKDSAYKNLQKQFSARTVKKEYVAILDGTPLSMKGKISLPLCADYDNRPHQIADSEHGKPSITGYEVVERYDDGSSRVVFYPYTGRTHQIRVHSAHRLGLGIPLKGDRLYGTPSDRLYLHAMRISFVHPETGKNISFFSPPPF